MDSSDIDSQITNETGSHDDDLLSLNAEVKERLEDYYAEIAFLERTSAAIHNHLQHDCHSSGPGDENQVTYDAGYIEYDDSTQQYYDEDGNNGDAGDANDDFQDEQVDDDTEEYEEWDDRDEYHD